MSKAAVGLLPASVGAARYALRVPHAQPFSRDAEQHAPGRAARPGRQTRNALPRSAAAS